MCNYLKLFLRFNWPSGPYFLIYVKWGAAYFLSTLRVVTVQSVVVSRCKMTPLVAAVAEAS